MSSAPTNVRDAVILAAGNGSRLSTVGYAPKPLVPVGGRPLIEYVTLALAAVGIRRVLIVSGYLGERLREWAPRYTERLSVSFVQNSAYHRPNGLSLLCAETHARAPFLLVMADHVFEVDTLDRFLAQAGDRESILAVDRRVDAVFDASDATRVVTENGRLRDIGKHLTRFDAIDTGIFLLGPGIFPALRASEQAGDGSLSDGIARFAAAYGMDTWDIGDDPWIDVDTPLALAEAERLVRAGFFAR